jgi:FAD:protein FMN transferase
MKKIVIVISLILAMFLQVSCSKDKNTACETNSFGMGTVISQKVYGNNSKKASGEVLERIKDIENTMTVNASGGDINKLNDNAGKGYVKLNHETVELLKEACDISDLSNGAFDVTVGSAVKLWGIGTENSQIPEEDMLMKLVRLINYKDVVLNESSDSAKLEKEGQKVDLGGIAKGYAGDEAIKIYKKYEVKNVLINLGGNVVAFGSKPDGEPWSVGIQDPRAENGTCIGVLKAIDKAVVTSGDYERYFEKDGKRYHHILDPKTGKPSESGIMSVTIIADSSTSADGLSTAAFVLGLEKGMQLVKSYGNAEAIFVTANKKVYLTESIKKQFVLNNESGVYSYAEKR